MATKEDLLRALNSHLDPEKGKIYDARYYPQGPTLDLEYNGDINPIRKIADMTGCKVTEVPVNQYFSGRRTAMIKPKKPGKGQ